MDNNLENNIVQSMEVHNAFTKPYDPKTFPVFCDHSVLETTVDGIGKIRVCNGMELSNRKKGFNPGLPSKILNDEDFKKKLRDFQSLDFMERRKTESNSDYLNGERRK